VTAGLLTAACDERESMSKRFSGKVALVTGGASGIGRAGAQLFAQEGAQVIVSTDSNRQGCEETCDLIANEGGDASFVQCDVSNEADVQALVEECVRRYGRLDFAFNNAGIGPDGKRVPVMNIVDCTEEIWDRTLDINLKGVFLCLKYEMRQMIKQGGGAIVNTSSVGAVKPMPGFCAYSASKGGLNVLTKTAALEGADHNIRVNTIMPGPTQNTLLFDYLTGSNPSVRGDMERDVPLHRLGYSKDMAEAVVWLCSDAANFITGQSLAIDGGITAR
jgi:NAD(P)-dependent dehydrogenase (short-subunit alcohol dehydrogenase family)